MWYVYVYAEGRVINKCGPLNHEDAEAAEHAYHDLCLDVTTKLLTEDEHAAMAELEIA